MASHLLRVRRYLSLYSYFQVLTQCLYREEVLRQIKRGNEIQKPTCLAGDVLLRK